MKKQIQIQQRKMSVYDIHPHIYGTSNKHVWIRQ